MSHKELVENLDSDKVLLILSHITEDMLQDIPEEEADVIQSNDDARQVIVALLNTTGENSENIDAATILPGDGVDAVGRRVLNLLLDDETMRTKAQNLVAHPPEETQMVIDPITGAIVLVALITWLQTKVDVDGEINIGTIKFKVKANKEPTDRDTLKDIAHTIMTLLTGQP
jgi:hypothetical protein